MCWMCEHPGSTVEDYLDEVRAKVSKHGWSVQYVESLRTPYAYTIGLHDRGLPEMLVTGVSPLRAVTLLNSAAEIALRIGEPLTAGAQIALRAGQLVEVVEVAQPDAHMYVALALNGGAMRALQLVWADRCGRLPWGADFDDGRGGQPVLGIRAMSN